MKPFTMKRSVLYSLKVIVPAFFLFSCSRNSEVSFASSSTVVPAPTPAVLNSVAFTGNSNSSSALSLRLVSGGIYTLTGTCDISLGAVLIGGNGIGNAATVNDPTTYSTPCLTDGTFTVVINGTCGAAPCMNNYGREVAAFQSGGTYSTTRIYLNLGTIVTTAAQLQAAFGTSGFVTLANDIDLSSIANWTPIDSSSNNYFLQGDGHTISNLTINAGSSSNVGFFSQGTTATHVKNIYFTNASVTSSGDAVGGVMGYANHSHFLNVSFSGTVNGGNQVGGIIGFQNNGSTAFFKDCSAAGTITATGVDAGGLIGVGFDLSPIRSFSTANISGSDFVGGLIGRGFSQLGAVPSIRDSASTGSVTCTANSCLAAGLIADLYGISLKHSNILRSYFSGSVHAPASGVTDALVAAKDTYTDVTSSYYLQGLTCNQCVLTNGSALSSAQMKSSASYVSWDFATPTWVNQTNGITLPQPKR
ncbi:MAG: hypothetical protein H7256_00350 [Bdellovibrio sp.]|nr:hypothetical protein [Bdellovibrio sp.]